MVVTPRHANVLNSSPDGTSVTVQVAAGRCDDAPDAAQQVLMSLPLLGRRRNFEQKLSCVYLEINWKNEIAQALNGVPSRAAKLAPLILRWISLLGRRACGPFRERLTTQKWPGVAAGRAWGCFHLASPPAACSLGAAARPRGLALGSPHCCPGPSPAGPPAGRVPHLLATRKAVLSRGSGEADFRAGPGTAPSQPVLAIPVCSGRVRAQPSSGRLAFPDVLCGALSPVHLPVLETAGQRVACP